MYVYCVYNTKQCANFGKAKILKNQKVKMLKFCILCVPSISEKGWVKMYAK